MAKKQELQPSPEQPVSKNREQYAQMFSEDYPDVDFNDREARYGKMVGDRLPPFSRPPLSNLVPFFYR